MQKKLTEKYSLLDAVIDPSVAMEMYKRLQEYEGSDLEPKEVTGLKRRVDVLCKLINSLRKETEIRWLR